MSSESKELSIPLGLGVPDGIAILNGLLEAIIDQHEPIKHHFRTEVGLRWQKDDSDIAEKVMLQMIDKDTVALPIHDSFVVQKEHAETLRHVMAMAFQDFVGVEPQIKQTANLTVWS